MNKFEKACIKEGILQLIRLKATGPPAELALKFDISVRTVKRIISELKASGMDIRYDYNSVSYVCKEK